MSLLKKILVSLEKMCGIFFYRSNGKVSCETLRLYFNKMNYRGPDHSEIYQLDDFTVIGFHRLSINDTSTVGHQPFELGQYIMVCNGEIFNHEELEEEFGFNLRSWSDCEVILHLFVHYEKNIEKVLSKINGEFAFVIYDKNSQAVYAARDPIGIRPLFFYQKEGICCFTSEAKGTTLRPCLQFPSGTYFYTHFQWSHSDFRFQQYSPALSFIDDTVLEKEKYPGEHLMMVLREAVYCRVKTTDRELGCFLSGGVDSLITTYFAAEAMSRLGRDPKKLKVFTIGFQGCDSADVAAATQIAKIFGVEHCVYTPPLELGFRAIPRTVYHLESWDTTTIRASVPQYLLSKYIASETNVRVLISGEGSDELLAGYLYFNNIPNEEEFIQERKKLVSNLMYFDVLRTDRTTAANGLEVRVPFLDSSVIYLIKQLESELIMPISEGEKERKMTKSYLREAFIEYISIASKERNTGPQFMADLAPWVWRTKDAFSDAVGHKWADQLQEYVVKHVQEDDPANHTHSPPATTEALYYRQVFESFYGKEQVESIPYYWMPNWQPESLKDPSARFLEKIKDN